MGVVVTSNRVIRKGFYHEMPFRHRPEDYWEKVIQVEGAANVQAVKRRERSRGGEVRELIGVNTVLPDKGCDIDRIEPQRPL